MKSKTKARGGARKATVQKPETSVRPKRYPVSREEKVEILSGIREMLMNTKTWTKDLREAMECVERGEYGKPFVQVENIRNDMEHTSDTVVDLQDLLQGLALNEYDYNQRLSDYSKSK